MRAISGWIVVSVPSGDFLFFNELLPVLGEDNLIPHEVDMVADNGDDRYGTVTDRVFILSCDEYRKYRKHVPLHPIVTTETISRTLFMC